MEVPILKFFNYSTFWGRALLLETIFCIFIVKLFPPNWQAIANTILFTAIFITSTFNLNSNRILMIRLAVSVMLIHWIAKGLDLEVLSVFSTGFNVMFFLTIVGSFILQIFNAKEINGGVILEAISGYLLMGLAYSLLISLLAQFEPNAYSFAYTNREDTIGNAIYFTFVSMTTVGFGDLLPKSDLARSLTILITVSGQFYLSIIVAVLVGKYAAAQKEN